MSERSRLRGPDGLRVDVIVLDRGRGPFQQYRVTQHGVFTGGYRTPEELAKVVDLAELVEDRG